MSCWASNDMLVGSRRRGDAAVIAYAQAQAPGSRLDTSVASGPRVGVGVCLMHVTTQKAQRRRAYAFWCHGWVRLSVMPVLSTMLFVDRVRRSQRTPTICNTQSARCRLFTLSPLHPPASNSLTLLSTSGTPLNNKSNSSFSSSNSSLLSASNSVKTYPPCPSNCRIHPWYLHRLFR